MTLRSAGLSYDAATARLKAAMGGAARPVALGLRVLGFDVATPAPPEALLGQGYSTETDVQEPGGANGAAAAADESAAQMVNTSPGFDALSFAEPGTAAGFGKPAAAGTAAASTGFGGVAPAKPSTGGGLFGKAGTAAGTGVTTSSTAPSKTSPFKLQTDRPASTFGGGGFSSFGGGAPSLVELAVRDALAAYHNVNQTKKKADMRYVVIPARPAGTEGWSADTLAALVTRDSMIGTGLAGKP